MEISSCQRKIKQVERYLDSGKRVFIAIHKGILFQAEYVRVVCGYIVCVWLLEDISRSLIVDRF